MNHWLSRLWKLRRIITIAPVALSLPFTSCTSMVKTKDHRPGHWEKFHTNAHLWRRVKDNPPVFHPSKMPLGYAANTKNGEWVVDVNDGASFFVPHQEVDGISPQLWRTEARNAVDLVEKNKQAKQDAKDYILYLPKMILITTVVGAVILLLLYLKLESEEDEHFSPAF